MSRQALEIYGAPVYVRHEIVHNKYVVDALKAKGVVFIKRTRRSPGRRPAGDLLRPRRRQGGAGGGARRASCFTIDATCPLVTKVHREAQVHHKRGRHIILIGHAGHPEVIGTMGQLPPGAMTLVELVDDVEALLRADGRDLAYVTQTTLSVDDTREIVEALQRALSRRSMRRRWRTSATPPPIARRRSRSRRGEVEAVIVVGAANSSNSQRLREVAERAGCGSPCSSPTRAAIDWARLRRAFARGHRRRLGAGDPGRTRSSTRSPRASTSRSRR